MSEPATICTKCSSKMEEGFIVEYSHASATSVTAWIEGPPEQSDFLGIPNGVKLKNKRQIPLRTFRCTSCGYVESYAK